MRFTGTPGDLPFLCNAVGSTEGQGFTFAPSYKQGGWACSLVVTFPNGGATINMSGAPSSINDGEWHHLLHSFDWQSEGVTYLDGVQVYSIPLVFDETASLSVATNVNIGQDPTGHYAESGEADIDDLGVWRRALSPYEAESVYLAGKNYGRTVDWYGPVQILMQNSSNGVELIWEAGSLETAPDVSGPWQPVDGASAPYYKASANGVGRFYRVRL